MLTSGSRRGGGWPAELLAAWPAELSPTRASATSCDVGLGHHEGDEGSGSGRRGEEEGQDQEIRRGAHGGDILE